MLSKFLEELRERGGGGGKPWREIARPAQLPPPGAWSTWIFEGGRGAGKTRTGAEFVMEEIDAGRTQRIHLVAPTVADYRDVMVEGPAGILAVSSNATRPTWTPSRRRLDFPNGVIALCFSADEPDRLRGPQCDLAWADEICLIAGTKIQTAQGEVPIEKVQQGMMVHTRKGLRRVIKSGMTQAAAEVYELSTSNGQKIIGTANHPVWIEGKGFIPLTLIAHGDILKTWDIKQNGMGKSGFISRDISKTARANCSTGRSIFMHMGHCLMALMSTILTATRKTMNLKILSLSPEGNTYGSMSPVVLQLGIVPKGVRQSRNIGLTGSQGSLYVRPVVRNFYQRGRDQSSAIKIVLQKIFGNVIRGIRENMIPLAQSVFQNPKRRNRSRSVLFAKRDLVQMTPGRNVVPATVATNGAISAIKIKKLPEKSAVYNLEVEGCHEYFANGILVHNCAWKYPRAAWDMLMFGLRMGQAPRALVTTTPRPIKLLKEIKALPSTVLTKSTTYENRDNLAPSFFSQIITKYEGTRLGRQEIMGEVLEDNPGALWNLKQIDDLRVTVPPELSRIVVAIDPAVTSNADSDETGIIIAARGRDKHGYVLGDWSQVTSPDTWARAAIRAHQEFKGDRIVAEVNQGGDMVETILRTIDRNVPYRAVHASRGKSTRAEPIAALYEQGRIHHVGTHAGLEDQMIQWDPVASKDSPDRVDALVWALTDLMVDNVEKGIRWL